MLPLIPPKAFSQARFTLRDDGAYQMPQLITRLVEAGYVRQERVEAPGQFAQRGGLLDIYPVGEEYPVRMEFFGDEVDSIRAFDAVSQRSVEKVREVRILPAGEMPLAADVLQTGIRALQLEKKRAVDTIKKLEAKELRANGGKVPERWMTAAPEDRPQARVERMVDMAIDKLLDAGALRGHGERHAALLSPDGDPAGLSAGAFGAGGRTGSLQGAQRQCGHGIWGRLPDAYGGRPGAAHPRPPPAGGRRALCPYEGQTGFGPPKPYNQN